MDPTRILSDDQKRDRFNYYFEKKHEEALLQHKSEIEKSLKTFESITKQLGGNRPRPILPK